MAKRQKKRKKFNIYAFAVSGLGIANVFLILFLLFYTRGAVVEGNTYCTKSEIAAAIQDDDLSINTLCVVAEYKLSKGQVPACIDHMTISLKNPWTLNVHVVEKTIVGYTELSDGSYAFFDNTGLIVYKSDTLLSDVPLVEGVRIEGKERYEKLNDNLSLFEKIGEITLNTQANALSLKRIIYKDSKIYMELAGGMYVSFGDEVTADKVALVPTLVNELGDKSGMLHMESYEESKDAVTFMENESIEIEEK